MPMLKYLYVIIQKLFTKLYLGDTKYFENLLHLFKEINGSTNFSCFNRKNVFNESLISC